MKITRKILGIFLLAIVSMALGGSCYSPFQNTRDADSEEPASTSIVVMALVDDNNADFENKRLTQFGSSKGYRIRYIPAYESESDLLAVYQQLFHDHSPKPDMCEIDVIWPSILADDLVDLKPYLGEDVKSFPPELMDTFTIRGRLVGIPLFMDTGLLYYRSDLLKKYGFGAPPQTWDDLERMAKVIQDGERRSGKSDFWGFVWQGQASEALTCDALEWQSSQGGGRILGPDKTVRVCNRNAISALARAVSWIGTISPPGVIAYDEDDSFNVWQSGNAAFMRSWVYIYGSARRSSCPVHDRFGVTTVPGGISGHSRALGGIAMAVSKYSEHREDSIAALRYLTSIAVEQIRAVEAGSVPTRWAVQQQAGVMGNTPFHGLLAGQVMTGVIARPSVVAGKKYDAVSGAYAEAVHRALAKQATPQEALSHLESELVRITGFRPVRD